MIKNLCKICVFRNGIITEAEDDRRADIWSDQAGVWILAVEPEGLGGSSGAVVLAMYGSQSAEGVWIMGSEEVRDSWEVREGGLGVYF
jgi:hypothetical protein